MVFLRRIFFISLLSATAFAEDFLNGPSKENIEPYIFEDIINSTFEAIRPLLPDPLTVDALELIVPDDVEFLKGSANVSNFELTGLSSFQISALNLAIIGTRLNFTVVLPSININTNYGLDLLLADLVPFYGAGRANIHISDAELQGSAQADLSEGISVKNLRVQLYLGSITFGIQGALDNEDFSSILNAVLNDVVTSFIDDHQELVSDIISPIVEIVINAILQGEATAAATSPPEA